MPGAFRPTPGGPVLLAMERNEAAAAAVATAYSLAETFQRPLLVLHARAAAEAAAFLNPCATTLEEFGIQSSGRFPVRCIVKDGNPADAIVEAIAENHPCILVAGVKRASETPGPHGTAFALLACSRVPVLCVPPEWTARWNGDRGLTDTRLDQIDRGRRLRPVQRFAGIIGLAARRMFRICIYCFTVFRNCCIWSDLPSMEFGSSQIRSRQTRIARRRPAGELQARPAAEPGVRVASEGRGQPCNAEARSRRMEAVRAHPVAELLECPPADRPIC